MLYKNNTGERPFFPDVDVGLFSHVGNTMNVSWGTGFNTGLVSVEYTINGESAHAAGAPWRGRSAACFPRGKSFAEYPERFYPSRRP